MLEQLASATLLRDFLKDYVVKTYRKGEIIIFQGEVPRTASVVKNGMVKVYNLSHSGDEKPVGFQSDKDIFPAPWVFGKAPSALYYYEAVTDVELYHVPREDYINFLKRNSNALYAQLERLITDYLGSMMRLNALQHSRASDKLVYTLH